MSTTHRIIDSQLKLNKVLKTFEAIGVEVEFKDKGNGYTFYIIGNDMYGWTQMHEDNGIVTEFCQYGIGDKRPIEMLFHCFDFIAYDTNDYDGDEFDSDLMNLPSHEFFVKYYPQEFEIREYLNEQAKWLKDEHPDLYSQITSNGREFGSYRFEYAYVKCIPIEEVTKVDKVVQFMYQQLIDEELEDNRKCIR